MAQGEVSYQVFSRTEARREVPTKPELPAFNLKECCFSLPALASTSSSDYYKNDKHSVIGRYDSVYYAGVIMYFQKHDGSDWQDVFTCYDDTYGTNYFYGEFTDGRYNYPAYIVDWKLVLTGLGEGSYRFRFEEYDYATNVTETIYPFEFCLKEYNADRADGTTRIETYTKGLRGDFQDDLVIWDFNNIADYVKGKGWFQQLRLPDSFFGGNKSEYSREFIRYQNGQQVWLQDEQIESYVWNSGFYPSLLHDFIKTDLLQSDTILVTDYNKNNPNIFKDKAVKCSGNYEPNWQYNNLKAFVNVDFVQEYQNRRKLRC